MGDTNARRSRTGVPFERRVGNRHGPYASANRCDASQQMRNRGSRRNVAQAQCEQPDIFTNAN